MVFRQSEIRDQKYEEIEDEVIGADLVSQAWCGMVAAKAFSPWERVGVRA
jgi:hypothetical protein